MKRIDPITVFGGDCYRKAVHGLIWVACVVCITIAVTIVGVQVQARRLEAAMDVMAAARGAP